MNNPAYKNKTVQQIQAMIDDAATRCIAQTQALELAEKTLAKRQAAAAAAEVKLKEILDAYNTTSNPYNVHRRLESNAQGKLTLRRKELNEIECHVFDIKKSIAMLENLMLEGMAEINDRA